jgi:hypothetical protein
MIYPPAMIEIQETLVCFTRVDDQQGPLWLPDRRYMVDSVVWRDLIQLVPLDRRPVVEALKADYHVSLEQIRDRVRADSSVPAQASTWEVLMQIQMLEGDLWKKLAAVSDSSADVVSVRRSWMRRAWLEAAGSRNLVFSAGIDLSSFVQTDWQTRQMLDTEKLQAADGTANAAMPLSDLVAEYQREMEVQLDDYKRVFSDNAMRAEKETNDARRSQLNLERHLLMGKPYSLTRKFAERAYTVLQQVRGRTAAAAWRDRFLRANDSALFHAARGAEAACLAALESHARSQTTADRALLTLAVRRWDASNLLQGIIISSLRNSREQPPVISDLGLLTRVEQISEWVSHALEDAARAVGCQDTLPTERTARWAEWFPKPTVPLERETPAPTVDPKRAP